jgi:hypothetical protein
MIDKLVRNIRFKSMRGYDLKEVGSSIYTKLYNDEAFNLLEFKQLSLAFQKVTLVEDRFLTPAIFDMIFDCYILSCESKAKVSNNYFYSKSETEIRFSEKNMTLKKIAEKTKSKYQNRIVDGYIDAGEWAVRGPLVWFRDEYITKEALQRFNEDRLVRKDLLKVFDKYLERKKEYDRGCTVKTLKDHVSGFYVRDIQRFQ